ncbi:SH3 domain-containing protein [Chryseobacterium antibioticum]|uniref:SH3 domain-containing protein n=1 Tax=Chryseobacterium pyrolae TaxID=2987481 RepID=A0ABT2ILD0_9FLAO|nr:SH3 domain-containing protein [Chryseobacterium pyrolae]MCT2409455.1 SH3 domain-containing protein [Chryseobacterium pyrolae]
MADWESLKSLRTHLKILNWVITGLILVLLIVAFRFFDSNPVKDSLFVSAKIIAKSGASIRDMPSKNGKVLIIAPLHSKIEIIQRKVQNDRIDHRKGSWVKVRYQKKTGYVWEYLID